MARREDSGGAGAEEGSTFGGAAGFVRGFCLLVEALPFDVWIRDAEQRCVWANAASEAHWPGLVGQAPDDSSIPEDVRDVWRQNNARVMAGEVVQGEVRYVVGGRERTYVNIIVPIRDGSRVCGTIGVNIDVTETRDAEQQSERRRDLLQGFFEHAPIAMGLRAVRGDDIVHVEDNPFAAALLASTPAGLRGKSERELGVPDDVVRRAIARFRGARERGGPVDFQLKLDTATGVRTLDGKILPMPRDDSGEERYALLAEDRSEVRQLQATLVHADRLASLGALAAGIGHEIRNPITYVVANVKAALDLVDGSRSTAAVELRERLTVALDGAERISALLRDMLAFSARRELDLEPVDVHEVIDSIVGLTRAEISRRVTLVRDEQRDVPAVRGNAVRLAQVLLNLVMNAVQAFGEDDGPGHHVWIRARREGDEVLVSVADDGPGIPAELRGRVFDPFVTSKGTSTGLGLYVSRVMMSQMSGRIDVRDRGGGGTEVVLALPVTGG
ncbi:MAG TPA: ATP-binding protein [Polyangiaceae bacterium]|nr:ATP-binding protein [Polyangiaceae bacterium]